MTVKKQNRKRNILLFFSFLFERICYILLFQSWRTGPTTQKPPRVQDSTTTTVSRQSTHAAINQNCTKPSNIKTIISLTQNYTIPQRKSSKEEEKRKKDDASTAASATDGRSVGEGRRVGEAVRELQKENREIRSGERRVDTKGEERRWQRRVLREVYEDKGCETETTVESSNWEEAIRDDGHVGATWEEPGWDDSAVWWRHRWKSGTETGTGTDAISVCTEENRAGTVASLWAVILLHLLCVFSEKIIKSNCIHVNVFKFVLWKFNVYMHIA